MEPIIGLFAASFSPFIFAIIPLYIEQTVSEGRNFTHEEDDMVNGTCSDRNTSTNPYYELKQEVASETAQWVMISTALIYFPAFFISPFGGVLGDRLGRKIQLLIPNVAFLCTICASLVVLYLDLPLVVFVSLSFILGCGGSFSFLLTGSFAYIADITRGKTRLMRIAIINAVFIGITGLAQIPVAYVFELYGVITCLWIFFVLMFCNILYILIPGCLYESLQVKKDTVNITLFKDVFKDFVHFLTTDGNRTMVLLLFYFIYFIISIVQLSQAVLQIFIVYGLGPPFCWSPVTEGVFTFSFLIAGTLGKYFATKQNESEVGNCYWFQNILYVLHNSQ